MTPSQTLAVFDFDATLVKNDSLWPFLIAFAGRTRTFLALARAVWRYALHDKAGIERRTFIKQELLTQLLAGQPIDSCAPAIQKLKAWVNELPTAAKLREHYAAGHHVVVASGGLSLYLPALLENMPHHALLCTEIAVNDGIIAGTMINGNCVRTVKAARVAAYMAEHGPFTETYGYGNAPHDLPMLTLMRHRVVV